MKKKTHVAFVKYVDATLTASAVVCVHVQRLLSSFFIKDSMQN